MSCLNLNLLIYVNLIRINFSRASPCWECHRARKRASLHEEHLDSPQLYTMLMKPSEYKISWESGVVGTKGCNTSSSTSTCIINQPLNAQTCCSSGPRMLFDSYHFMNECLVLHFTSIIRNLPLCAGHQKTSELDIPAKGIQGIVNTLLRNPASLLFHCEISFNILPGLQIEAPRHHSCKPTESD